MEFNNQYLTYAEYIEIGGTLDEAPFNILEFKAQKEIDKYTFGRLTGLDIQKNEVKVCIFELIKTLTNPSEEPVSSNKSSESYPGYSVSYTTLSNDLIKAKETEIGNIITTYLSNCKLDDGTPYLYRGVDKYVK